MGLSRRRGYRRAFLTTTMAVIVGVVCTTTISKDLVHNRPRDVFVTATATINPAATTTAIADSDVWGLDQAGVDKTMDMIKATNVSAVRLMIPWAAVETSTGTLNWSSIDKTVNSAASRNIAVVGMVNATPRWAVVSGGQYLSSRPSSAAAYADFVAKFVARYAGKIAAVEIWNEPNSVTFWTPTPDPAAYTELLKAAYPKVKAVDPSIVVISAGLGAIQSFGSLTINPVAYLTQMYAAGAGPYFDALSFHPYLYTLKFSGGVGKANSPVQQLMDLRKVMIANGNENKKIWATEYGQPSASGGEARENEYIADILLKWQELPYTGPMFIYTTRDRASLGNQSTFGIYRTDWTPKTAVQTVRAAASGAIAKSAEFQQFSTVSDPALGTVLSPVYKTTDGNWAQVRTVSTVFQASSGFVSSPNPVADKAGSYLLSPTTQFANGYQDFNKSTGLRVWYSEATGAHSAAGHTAKVWVPELGLATSDETGGPTGTYTTFQYGKITWNPLTGTKIIWADGHGPGTTPTSTTATTTTTPPTTATTVPTTTAPPVTTTAPPITTTPKPVGNPIVAVLTLLSGLLGSLGGR
ncbi:cellulase family glycosylhydrolase [Mycobacterium sp. NPDC048908]|uniref:cellulase family glycosylhydrolase n=1 Tax=Mycobacterium sp. NPDC048908 TaxID=3364292 RepID=UPI00371CB89E